jgi:hypothetical protein
MARASPRRQRSSGRHDRPRRTAPVATAHFSTDNGKRAFGGDGTHQQRGLARRQRGSGDLATSCCELDDDLWGTERVRAAAADFKEERGTAALTRGGWWQGLDSEAAAQRSDSEAAAWRSDSGRGSLGQRPLGTALDSEATARLRTAGQSAPLWRGCTTVLPRPANSSAARGGLVADRRAPCVSDFQI